MSQPNVDEKGIHYGFTHGNSMRIPQDVDWFKDFTPNCFGCDYYVDSECTNEFSCEVTSYICDKPDFKATYNSNTNDIIILYSDRTEKCLTCSPCAPNGGDLEHPDERGVETYTFPSSWIS